MKSISLAKLHAVAPSRKPGYVEAVMAAATAVSDTHITLEEQDFDRIRREYAQSVSLLQKATNFATSAARHIAAGARRQARKRWPAGSLSARGANTSTARRAGSAVVRS
jgi:hypothetical protein